MNQSVVGCANSNHFLMWFTNFKHRRSCKKYITISIDLISLNICISKENKYASPF